MSRIGVASRCPGFRVLRLSGPDLGSCSLNPTPAVFGVGPGFPSRSNHRRKAYQGVEREVVDLEA